MVSRRPRKRRWKKMQLQLLPSTVNEEDVLEDNAELKVVAATALELDNDDFVDDADLKDGAITSSILHNTTVWLVST